MRCPRLRTEACELEPVTGGTTVGGNSSRAKFQNGECVRVCASRPWPPASFAFRVFSPFRSLPAMATDPLRGSRKILPAPVATAVLLFKGASQPSQTRAEGPPTRSFLLPPILTLPSSCTIDLPSKYVQRYCYSSSSIVPSIYSIRQLALGLLPRTFRRRLCSTRTALCTLFPFVCACASYLITHYVLASLSVPKMACKIVVRLHILAFGLVCGSSAVSQY